MAEHPKLEQALIQLGLCSSERIDEALSNQVLYGGTLGTNLLEIGAVTEPQLATALGKFYGLPFLASDIVIDPSMARLVARDLVERTEIVPFLVEDHRIHVLVGDPTAVAALDEFAFKTGKKIIPTVAVEERVWSLMRQVYGIERQFRVLSPALKPAQKAEEKAAPAPDLMSEAEFDALYSKKRSLEGPETEKDPIGSRPPGGPTKEKGPIGSREQAALAPLAGATEADLPEIELLEEDLPEVEIVPSSPELLPTPLTFAEAAAALAGVDNRDAIAQTVLRYALSHFKRSVLLVVRGAVADGWEGLGEGMTRAKVRGLRLKLGTPSVFETVVAAQAHYLGPMLKTQENVRFLRALGGGAPKSVFVIPILVRGRVVNALYADNGRGGMVDPDVGELLILAAKIGQSYDALLARRE